MSKALLKVITLAATGFVAGILLAPKSGKQTRKDIKHKADELIDQAEAELKSAKRVAKKSAATIKVGAKEALAEVEELGSDVKKSAKSVTTKAKFTSKSVAKTAVKTAKAVKADATSNKKTAQK
jgi:gas vesicle protein